IAALQQLDDAPAGHEAGAAGHQDSLAHGGLLPHGFWCDNPRQFVWADETFRTMAGLTLQDLSMLEAVAERMSFRGAAAALRVSPSALSHAVAAVERRLGVRLFNRTTRSVALTEAGEQFLARVRPALREIDGAVEGVNRFRDTPAGLLRLNA